MYDNDLNYIDRYMEINQTRDQIDRYRQTDTQTDIQADRWLYRFHRRIKHVREQKNPDNSEMNRERLGSKICLNQNITELNIKYKSIKLIEENIEAYLDDLGFADVFQI